MFERPLRHTMVEGTTEPQDFELFKDGATAFADGDLDDADISIEWVSGPAAEDQPTVDWLDQDAGTVRCTDCENMPAGSHKFRWKLTRGGTEISYIPNLTAERNTWRVVAV